MNHDAYPDYYLADILRETKTIALVGASPNAERPSHRVMAFLLRKGYRVIPINPGHVGKAIQGQTVVGRLAAVKEPIDMVDVFHALEADGVARFQASWRELQDDVADALVKNRG